MEEQTIICKRCGKPAPHGVLFSDGECLVCYQKALPQCQFPGCTTKCLNTGEILCDAHFHFLTRGKFSEAITRKFINMYAQKGKQIRIIYSEE